ncbi:MAG: hypothetical protein RSD05_08510 [Comamonas sp.]
MALTLDTRQRAMLQEMGITVWLPKSAVPTTAPAVVSLPAAVQREAVAATAVQAMPAPVQTTPAQPAVEVPVTATTAAPAAPATRPAAPSAPATPAAATAPEATAFVEWRMSPAVQAYPQATGGSADNAWLVIWECANPATPLQGDTGKLLNNMLRALRLHHSPHVWIASVQRPGQEDVPVASLPAAPVDWQPLASCLLSSVQQTRPARVLVLGMHTARAVLGSQEALGRLRAQVHQIHRIPAVVSYDPAYLLRSPHAKPAAWADLCRAHALHPPPAV